MPDSVRIVGRTVVRPARPWTASVHALLAHLRTHGLDREVPEPLADDSVAFLPGEVPAYPMPGWVWHPRRLDEAGRLLRRIHDATAGFDHGTRTWRLPAHDPVEVVCHNDFAPYNLVHDPHDHRLTGVIDFDAASPGPRAWDVAYLAYRLVPLADPANPDLPPAADAPGRLEHLVAAYGAPLTTASVLEQLPGRLEELAATAPDPTHRAIYAKDAAYARSANSASTAY
jgi:aminoglycoside phosphotransferase (APT) family kinase protein